MVTKPSFSLDCHLLANMSHLFRTCGLGINIGQLSSVFCGILLLTNHGIISFDHPWGFIKKIPELLAFYLLNILNNFLCQYLSLKLGISTGVSFKPNLASKRIIVVFHLPFYVLQTSRVYGIFPRYTSLLYFQNYWLSPICFKKLLYSYKYSPYCPFLHPGPSRSHFVLAGPLLVLTGGEGWLSCLMTTEKIIKRGMANVFLSLISGYAGAQAQNTFLFLTLLIWVLLAPYLVLHFHVTLFLMDHFYFGIFYCAKSCKKGFTGQMSYDWHPEQSRIAQVNTVNPALSWGLSILNCAKKDLVR